MKILKRICICIAVLIAICLAVLFINDQVNKNVFLTEYTFSHGEVPPSFDGYKILHISDLHNAPFATQITAHIKKQKPDMIVITGDTVQLPDHNAEQVLKIAKEVGDIPIYAVSGNHETQSGHYDEIIESYHASGIIPLDNDSVCVEKGNDSFLLLGIKDPTRTVVTEEHIEEIKEQIESEFPDGPCFSVLLSHRADLYPRIKSTSADLILSGHLHGGIVRLPFIGGLFGKNTEGRLFPEYEYGLYENSDGAAMIVSGGCDKNPKKRRYFNPPEVVLITLKSKGK